jgi:hypothetical protein
VDRVELDAGAGGEAVEHAHDLLVVHGAVEVVAAGGEAQEGAADRVAGGR